MTDFLKILWSLLADLGIAQMLALVFAGVLVWTLLEGVAASLDERRDHRDHDHR